MRRAVRRLSYVPGESAPQRLLINTEYTLTAGQTLEFFEVRDGGEIVISGDNVTINDGIVIPSNVSNVNHGIRTIGGSTTVSNITITNITAEYNGASANRVLNLTRVGGVNTIENVTVTKGTGTPSATPVYFNLYGPSVFNVDNLNVSEGGFHGMAIDNTVDVAGATQIVNLSNSSFIENSSHGIQIQATYGDFYVNLDNITASDNGARGIVSIPSGTTSGLKYRVDIANSTVENNGNGGIVLSRIKSGTDTYFISKHKLSNNTVSGNGALVAEKDLHFVSINTSFPYGVYAVGNTIDNITNDAITGNVYIEGTSDFATLNTVVSNGLTAGKRKEVPFGFVDLTDQDATLFVRNLSTGALAISQSTMNAVNALAAGLKTAGLWTKLVCFYPQVGLNSNAMGYGLKTTGVLGRIGTHSTLTEAGGSQPADTSSYTTTTENANGLTQATYFAEMLAKGSTPATQDVLFQGFYNGVGYDDVYGHYGSYGSGDDIKYVDVISSGFLGFSYNSAGTSRLWRNGVLVSDQPNESGTVIGPNQAMRLNRYTDGSFPGTHRIGSFGYFNQELTITEQADLYTLVTALNTAISRS